MPETDNSPLFCNSGIPTLRNGQLLVWSSQLFLYALRLGFLSGDKLQVTGVDGRAVRRRLGFHCFRQTLDNGAEDEGGPENEWVKRCLTHLNFSWTAHRNAYSPRKLRN